MRGELSPLIFMGVLLILLGFILILIPLVERVGFRLENLHPLIFVGRRFNGLFLGTSPILLIIMLILYLLLFMRR